VAQSLEGLLPPRTREKGSLENPNAGSVTVYLSTQKIRRDYRRLAAEYRKTIDIDLLNADENRTIHELLLTMSQTPLSGHETVFNIASKIREDYNDMRSKITKESTP
jgi:hypothetical protein